jgi:branched-chain amino acid transport system ATP-binding protein
MNTMQVNRAGIARTFQNIRLFKTLSVLDNVLIGMHNSIPYSPAYRRAASARLLREERVARERALELLSIFEMQDMADQEAGSLPYGAQRRLEIVRALGTNPSLLLLDGASRRHEPLGNR